MNREQIGLKLDKVNQNFRSACVRRISNSNDDFIVGVVGGMERIPPQMPTNLFNRISIEYTDDNGCPLGRDHEELIIASAISNKNILASDADSYYVGMDEAWSHQISHVEDERERARLGNAYLFWRESQMPPDSSSSRVDRISHSLNKTLCSLGVTMGLGSIAVGHFLENGKVRRKIFGGVGEIFKGIPSSLILKRRLDEINNSELYQNDESTRSLLLERVLSHYGISQAGGEVDLNILNERVATSRKAHAGSWVLKDALAYGTIALVGQHDSYRQLVDSYPIETSLSAIGLLWLCREIRIRNDTNMLMEHGFSASLIETIFFGVQEKGMDVEKRRLLAKKSASAGVTFDIGLNYVTPEATANLIDFPYLALLWLLTTAVDQVSAFPVINKLLASRDKTSTKGK